ncbi:MAG: hypothetical protein IPJ04_18715 [Candidatus Eisenbacteria bacterium]|nr:hypothetical protein [Candidatus Eisenbacteria bacterium]
MREALGGQLGTQPDVDDDGDGRFDEEVLNGLDDDGDGEVDEDLGVSAAQKLYAEYVDDRPEALDYGYSGGEPHEALHLSVKQEAMAWSVPGYDRIAGVRFKITNHGTETLEDVRIGVFADLDVSAAGESGGHLNDRAENVYWQIGYNDGIASVPSVNVADFLAPAVPYTKSCVGMLAGTGAVVRDGVAGNGLPVFGIVPLSHTLDPLAIIRKSALVDNRSDPYITGRAAELRAPRGSRSTCRRGRADRRCSTRTATARWPERFPVRRASRSRTTTPRSCRAVRSAGWRRGRRSSSSRARVRAGARQRRHDAPLAAITRRGAWISRCRTLTASAHRPVRRRQERLHRTRDLLRGAAGAELLDGPALLPEYPGGLRRGRRT